MTMMRKMFTALSILTLSACGGGGAATSGGTGTTTPTVSDFSFTDLTSQASDDLIGATRTTATRSTAGETGTLDRATNGFRFGDLSGAINADRTEITLDGGGTATFDPTGNVYSGRLNATPLGGDQIIGIAASLDTLPTGTASYAGTSVVTIQDNFTVYDLTGGATIDANFGTGTVTTEMSGLDGVATDGFSDPTDVTDVGTITFNGSAIDGARYSGGTLVINSDTLTALTDNAISSLDGAFFGPAGVEAGGVFVVDDTDAGVVTIFGDFIAK
jgi:hypothetical protein